MHHFLSNLGFRTILIEPRQRGKVLLGNGRRVELAHKAIGIGRVANHYDLLSNQFPTTVQQERHRSEEKRASKTATVKKDERVYTVNQSRLKGDINSDTRITKLIP